MLAIKLIITTLLIRTIRQLITRQTVLNVIRQRRGLLQHLIMTASISPSIQVIIKVNGIPVRIATLIQAIMHPTLAMLSAIKLIIIRTKIVIHVIREVNEWKLKKIWF
jgi:hypothetical protein